jgi:hypothetical protein
LQARAVAGGYGEVWFTTTDSRLGWSRPANPSMVSSGGLGSGTVVANALIHGVDGARNQIWLAETNIDRIDVHTYSPSTPAAICA